MTADDFFHAWRGVSLKPPFVLPGDAVLLEKRHERRRCVLDLRQYLADPNFGSRDKRLHLGLLPHPFAGRIDSAPVVLLCLNPGLNPQDYFGEYQFGFDAIRRRNLVQGPLMPWLDPQLSWHSGFKYWHAKFAGIIDEVRRRRRISRLEALRFVGEEIALLQLVPYHSASFGLPRRLVEQLESVRLARTFLNDVLLPRARNGKALVVCTRAAKRWRLDNEDSVLVYGPAQARGASIGPNTQGGKRILERLLA